MTGEGSKGKEPRGVRTVGPVPRGLDLALVVHDFDPGLGQGRYCIELARRLAARHRVTIFANRFAVPEERGWEYVRVPAVRTTALTTVFSFLAVAELRVSRRRFDVVHAQGLTCWGADVITAHVCNLARHRVAPPAGWRARLFATLVNPVEAAFFRQRRARHLIAISRQVAGEVRGCYRWTRPVSVIHHGVDTTRFRPAADVAERAACRARYGLPAEGWVWLFVGEAVKGLGAGLEQLPAFPGARLLAVTRSDPAPYLQRARALGVADRFHLGGPEDGGAFGQAYRAADVFVYPSAYDTFGMVVLEAMASGLPVVVGRDIGAAELIEDGENGFLIDPARPAQLGAVLERLAAQPDAAVQLGHRAHLLARTRSWDACAAATEEVYLATRLRGVSAGGG